MQEQQIYQEALNLPPAIREVLAVKIFASLEEEPLFLKEWAEEAERRIDAYDAGLVEARSIEEVFSKYNL